MGREGLLTGSCRLDSESYGIMVLLVMEYSEHNLEHSQVVFQKVCFFNLGEMS